MTAKEIMQEKIKQVGKGEVLEQAIRVTQTFSRVASDVIVGKDRKEDLFNQVSHLQASIELIKVAYGITSNDLSAKVGEILGIVEDEEEPEKTTTTKKTTQTKKR